MTGAPFAVSEWKLIEAKNIPLHTNTDDCGVLPGNSSVAIQGPTSLELFPSPQLTCGPAANETLYDHLEGIINRESHPPYAEPEVAMIFKKNEMEEVDLNVIESNLKQSFEELTKFRAPTQWWYLTKLETFGGFVATLITQ
ncbi:predicted protein [Nematostella vectensis]|uniref:Uncharacterized protein n=1 Tax=Nematostella vectensis TaxID=45351 RepID=A7RL93_NEMVE|nr:predicted protein [Nematostella vectensis]|eukprot:XP_001639952.1 predicted protein [Nematostella vectensis]